MSEQEPPAFKEVQDILHDAVEQKLITMEEAQERIDAYRLGWLGRRAVEEK